MFEDGQETKLSFQKCCVFGYDHSLTSESTKEKKDFNREGELLPLEASPDPQDPRAHPFPLVLVEGIQLLP